MTVGTISGTGTDDARHAYERAKWFLEVLDSVLSGEQAAAKSELQRTDLEDALENLRRARAELDRFPAGGALAEALMAALMNRVRFDVDEVRSVRRGRIRGHATNKKNRKDRVRRQYAKIRRLGAKLPASLSVSAKAKTLARLRRPNGRRVFPQSVRTLRRILSEKNLATR